MEEDEWAGRIESGEENIYKEESKLPKWVEDEDCNRGRECKNEKWLSCI